MRHSALTCEDRTPPPTDDYVESLEAGARAKAALFGGWIRSGLILDLGTGPGGVAAALASARPESTVIGVDRDPAMVAAANVLHGGPRNLEFRSGSATEPAMEGLSTIVLSSVLHEVHAQSGSVRQTLLAAFRSLRPRGRLLVRDFVRPAAGARRVLFEHGRSDMRAGQTFQDFAESCPWPIRFDGVDAKPDGVEYATDYAAVHEYLFRKDSGREWQRELAELYGFWSFEAATAIVAAVGFRIVRAERRRNDWVLRNRLSGHVRILDLETRHPLRLPAEQILLVAERPAETRAATPPPPRYTRDRL